MLQAEHLHTPVGKRKHTRFVPHIPHLKKNQLGLVSDFAGGNRDLRHSAVRHVPHLTPHKLVGRLSPKCGGAVYVGSIISPILTVGGSTVCFSMVASIVGRTIFQRFVKSRKSREVQQFLAHQHKNVRFTVSLGEFGCAGLDFQGPKEKKSQNQKILLDKSPSIQPLASPAEFGACW